MAWYHTTTRQAFSHRAISAVCQSDLLVNGSRSRLSSGQPADHERPRISYAVAVYIYRHNSANAVPNDGAIKAVPDKDAFSEVSQLEIRPF